MSVPLSLADADAGLRLIFLVGFCLLGAVGARFAVYAALNYRTAIETQRVLWEYLTFAGAVAALTGVVGIVDLAVGPTGVRGGVALTLLLLLGLTVREIHYVGAVSASERRRAAGLTDPRRLTEVGFVGVAVAVVALGGFGVGSATLRGVEAAAAVLFGGYGAAFAVRYLRHVRTPGTMLDAVLRHLFPVLAFTALFVAIDAAALVGVSDTTTGALRATLLVMTATALMTATVEVHANVRGPG
ncbi:MAG: hypothetical protein ABEJ68_10290 [Halobacteriaceae archaeon]